MKLILTTDDGTVLDSVDITPEEFRQETRLSPHGFLAQLQPGEEALR